LLVSSPHAKAGSAGKKGMKKKNQNENENKMKTYI